MSSSGIEAEYRRRCGTFEAEFAEASARAQTLLLSLLGAVLALAYVMYRLVVGSAPACWLLGPLAVCVVLVPLWQRARRVSVRAMRLHAFYERGLGRVDGSAVQSGHTGEAFRESGHLYDRDLNVLGEHSLFGMLATTRTAVGQRGLAGMLLHGAGAETVKARQEAVRELAPMLELREEVALLGASAYAELPAESFDRWLSGVQGGFEPWMRWVLLALTAGWIAVLAVAFARHADLGEAVRNAAGVLAVQGAFCLWLRPRVAVELEAAQRLPGQTEILRAGLRLVREQEFGAGLLVGLQELVAGGGERSFAAANDTPPFRDETSKGWATRGSGGDAEAALGALERSLTLVEQRSKEWYYAPALLMGVGTHAAVSLSLWRAKYGEAMRRWVAAWAEFEALLAVSAYAAEHEANVYPEIVGGGAAEFAAEGLVHPLLARGVAVANDVQLDGEVRFLLISGSNMAGKSTLLRAMGCNVVLALAGAPVCARRARMSALRVGASLALVDSLAEGKSKFLAEVERLRDLVALARGEGPAAEGAAAEGPASRAQGPDGESEGAGSLGRGSDGECLFLIDEIFSGTNSADRRVSAEAVLRGLVGAGAIGALSTHDLALAELADVADLHGRNVHMASPVEDDPLGFDYLLKTGVNRTTNALAIVRMLGLGG